MYVMMVQWYFNGTYNYKFVFVYSVHTLITADKSIETFENLSKYIIIYVKMKISPYFSGIFLNSTWTVLIK